MKTSYHLSTSFFNDSIIGMSEIPLNRFEKGKRVIELYLQDKTIREIAKEVHMSFRKVLLI